MLSSSVSGPIREVGIQLYKMYISKGVQTQLPLLVTALIETIVMFPSKEEPEIVH